MPLRKPTIFNVGKGFMSFRRRRFCGGVKVRFCGTFGETAQRKQAPPHQRGERVRIP